tara:strand:+ start:22 stop:1002 length:981 start_codon:yes stop_codon:yes gene_type:complete
VLSGQEVVIYGAPDYICRMNDMVTPTASDIATENWVDRWAPTPWRPYLRLARIDRPIGTWLLLIPCWWSTAMASEGAPSLWFMTLFGVGALVMRGAGCVVNDLADRNFDSMVARTATRPIASGQVSVPQALLFIGLLCGLGFLVLLQFNAYTVYLGFASLALIVVYPFMKRFTYWPQAILGLTFNWGALVGWSAVTGEIQAPALWLYVAGIFWTLGYDTIYAHQDKADDLLVGVKSTALKFGDETPKWLIAFYMIAVAFLGVSGWLAELAWPYFAGVGAGIAHLLWQVRAVDLDNPKSCHRFFNSNRDFGLIVLAGIVLAGPAVES